jgi:hypothetical protein
MREPKRLLLVYAESLPPALRAQLLDPAGWYLTQGDSDIDRPGA